ncbi:MAG TPA: exodeoxyribonuclease VII small subunit [Deltaproteobacteria bacterium]|nr:exodeoxyribonuclease VII small subunit [Deltaproteobacteria bacterium]
MKNKLNYTAAITELEKIVQEIESGEVDVDVLTEKVKRASKLIKFCNENLKNTQKEVSKVLEDIETGSEKKDE